MSGVCEACCQWKPCRVEHSSCSSTAAHCGLSGLRKGHCLLHDCRQGPGTAGPTHTAAQQGWSQNWEKSQGLHRVWMLKTSKLYTQTAGHTQWDEVWSTWMSWSDVLNSAMDQSETEEVNELFYLLTAGVLLRDQMNAWTEQGKSSNHSWFHSKQRLSCRFTKWIWWKFVQAFWKMFKVLLWTLAAFVLFFEKWQHIV